MSKANYPREITTCSNPMTFICLMLIAHSTISQYSRPCKMRSIIPRKGRGTYGVSSKSDWRMLRRFVIIADNKARSLSFREKKKLSVSRQGCDLLPHRYCLKFYGSKTNGEHEGKFDRLHQHFLIGYELPILLVSNCTSDLNICITWAEFLTSQNSFLRILLGFWEMTGHYNQTTVCKNARNPKHTLDFFENNLLPQYEFSR